ncbi:MAG TPA: HAD family hydrolase [Steroidobacteraceae bacterium]|jgi:D-glycero-D-manno-heptose 1,7-bisphosphate phosphatase|nr:HAD family hydrolase [Steroidobacteraceae bacterium]
MVSAQSVERVVLMDRDGTLVVDRDYLADPAGLEFLPGAVEALRRLHERGYRIVIISNQSGVGRGLFSLERLREINARLAQMVREAGAALAGIYCCPHRPDENCVCRKPNVELVRQAAQELHFDPAAAVMIGDRDSDIELGRRLGATTIRLVPGPASPGTPFSSASGAPSDHVAADLLEAARIIEAMERRPPVA